MKKSLPLALFIILSHINPAYAEDLPRPNVLPNSTTLGVDSANQILGGSIEFTADQISSLPPEARAAAQAALDAAMASQPVTQDQLPAIPSKISGISKDVLSQLSPEQLRLLEEAKKTGTIPSGVATALESLDEIPSEIFAQLTNDQKAVIEKAKAAGLFNKQLLTDLMSKADPKVIASLAAGGPITSEMIKKLQNKISITCIKGKKTLKLVAKSCPKGYKKK